MNYHKPNAVLTGLILAAAMSRLVPHPPNFTAVGAVALFGGATLTRRWHAVLVPVVAMAITDLLLGLAVYGLPAAFRHAPVVYACMALTAVLGRSLGCAWTRVGLGAALAAALSFVVVNFVVWTRGVLYPLDLAGLLACYAAAVPYALNTLLGNLAFGLALFGSWHLAQQRWPALAAGSE